MQYVTCCPITPLPMYLNLPQTAQLGDPCNCTWKQNQEMGPPDVEMVPRSKKTQFLLPGALAPVQGETRFSLI